MDDQPNEDNKGVINEENVDEIALPAPPVQFKYLVDIYDQGEQDPALFVLNMRSKVTLDLFQCCLCRETRNKFTSDLLQRVFDPWLSNKMEQLLSSVRNRLLKPVCDDVAHQPSIKNIQNLKDLVQRLPSSTLQHLQEYTLFPMQLQLNNAKLGSEIKVELINGIRHVVEKTEILHLEQLFKLYVFVFLQIFDPTQSSMVASVSEELKLSVVQCATQVLRSTTANVLDQMYQKENVPKLGQGIYICMQLLQTERLRALR
uniref:TTI1 N-terminal TPR domain-containing protein n=1 Tax=Timema cristinae TaxID=61476 RepID=A0A7R9GPJ0_TIMCR|nr:unnamed protein product [Timema cristinae]